MEDFRRHANNVPYLVAAGKKPPSVISVPSSEASRFTEASEPYTARTREAIEISDSEDEESLPERAVLPHHTGQSHDLKQIMNRTQQPAKNIHIPTNQDMHRAAPRPPYQPPIPPRAAPPTNPTWETFNQPSEEGLYDPIKTAAEAEKDLKEFFQQAFDGRDESGESEPIDMQDAIVSGFKDNIRLLPHQIVGRKWMAEREKGKKHGGILADDMGLGKTIQTLTRIVEGRPRKADKEDGWDASTLVIAPVSLVSQWATEIGKMVDGFTVKEHHGANRTTDPNVLKRSHVVVTSYQTVASEYAVFQPSAKDESQPKPSKSKSKITDSDYDSDDVELFGRALAKRKKPAAKKAKAKDALFRVNWFRIVLDEAHNIKNRKTKAAIACCALESKFQWCLTGTPMQNNVEELYSLLNFLRIKPLNDWDTFNEQIAKPVKKGKSTRAMKRLHVVLKGVMLRRKKTDLLDGKPLIELPGRHVNIVPCEFDEDETQFYYALENKIEAALEKFTNSEKLNYTSVLVLLLRLRQACNHPSLVAEGYRKDLEALAPRPASKDGSDDEVDELADELAATGIGGGRKCPVCQSLLTSSTTADDDVHCTDCVALVRTARRKSMKDSSLPPDSAKIRKILELLDEIEEREEEDGAPANEKTIVFSQFTSMLDIIQVFLKDRGIKYARYDGSMPKDKREASINAIKSDKQTTVILISFKAGSTGLNLTACNNVILVDMWWNPALEEQAFDRAHRFGQTRDVNIYKLTIEKTVEERILQLQEQKRMLAAAALSGDKLKNSKLGLDDLLALFRPGRDDED